MKFSHSTFAGQVASPQSAPFAVAQNIPSPQSPSISGTFEQLQSKIHRLEDEAVTMQQKYLLLNRHHAAQSTNPVVGPTFPLFPLLRPELRVKVWKLSCHVPRVHQITVDEEPTNEEPGDADWRMAWHCNTPPPSVIHACRESRVEALRIYQMLRDVAPTTPYSPSLYIGYFNFNADILWIKDDDWPEDFHHFQHMMVDDIKQYPRVALNMRQWDDFGTGLMYGDGFRTIGESAEEVILVQYGYNCPSEVRSPVLVDMDEEVMLGDVRGSSMVKLFENWFIIHQCEEILRLRNDSSMSIHDIPSSESISETLNALDEFIDKYEKRYNHHIRKEARHPSIRIMAYIKDDGPMAADDGK